MINLLKTGRFLAIFEEWISNVDHHYSSDHSFTNSLPLAPALYLSDQHPPR
jgi:hypothetical protein